MGWTETRIDYDMDPQGLMAIIRTDPMGQFWDATSRRRNLADAKHIFNVREIPTKEAQDEFLDFELDDLDAVWAKDSLSESKSPHDAMQAPYYRHDQSPDIDKQTKKVTLVEVQWWESEKAHKIVDPETGKSRIIGHADFTKLQSRVSKLNELVKAQGLSEIPPLSSVAMKRRVYKRAILGGKTLKIWDGPKEGGFTYKCMTGKRDRNQGTWYGIVRAMIDPQKWANKWLSQVLHVINTNAKGGYWAESDAFENPQEAMDTMSDPAAVTLVTPGTLQKEKIKAKEVVQYPEGIDRLMQFAISSIRDTTGVNLELLGMANKDQPGILEHQRKQAGMTILAGLFDSLRHYRKEQGKLMLWYITNFLSDGRLIRIGGQDNAQYVPLIRDPQLAEYDVIVDDTPSSPNQKEATWAVLVQMFPVLAKIQAPLPLWLKLLEYSPLPSALIADINQMMDQQQQQQKPDPAMIKAQAEAQAATTKAQAQVQSAQSKAQAEGMRAQADVQAAQIAAQAGAHKTMAEAHSAHADAAATAHGAVNDANVKSLQMLIGAILDAQGQQADQALKQQQMSKAE